MLKLKFQELHNCPHMHFNGEVYVQILGGIFEQVIELNWHSIALL